MKLTKQMSSLIVRAMLILALVFQIAPLAEAQTLAAKGKPAAAKPKSQASTKPTGGQHEGIKVHGHWTIEVRNPDGTLVSRHEFENALDPGAARILPAVIVGVVRLDPNSLKIRIGDACGSSSAPAPCTVPVTASPFTSPYNGTLVLGANATASHDAIITSVQTLVDYAEAGPLGITTPQVGAVFTSKTTSPVQVVTGQMVQVTVVISVS